MDDDARPAAWEPIRARARALPQSARAVFALAVAEQLVRRSRPEQDPLRDALVVGWQAVKEDGRPWRVVQDQLGRRADLDEDDVAAVWYALGAVGGSADDAEWAAQRCVDAAFERISHYLQGATASRPLDVDTADPEVQAELRWQTMALDLLENDGATSAVISRLRA